MNFFNSKFFYLNIAVLLFWLPTKFGLKEHIPFVAKFSLFELVVFTMALIIIANSYSTKNRLFQSKDIKRTYWFFIIFAVAGLISHFFSSTPTFLSTKLRYVFLLPLATFIVIQYKVKTADTVVYLMRFYLRGVFILAVIILVGPIFFNLGTVMEEIDARLSLELSIPLFGKLMMHPASIGYFFSLAYTMAFSNMMLNTNKRNRYWSALITLIIALAVIQSNTRGALIAIVFATVLILFLIRRRKLRKGGSYFFIAIGLLTAIFAYFIYISLYTKSYIIQDRLLEMLDPMSSVNMVARLDVWQNIQGFLKISIFGTGLQGIGVLQGATVGAIHNMVLFYILSSGFLGLIAFIVIQFRILKRLLKSLRKENGQDNNAVILGGIGTISALWICGLVSSMSFQFWGLIMIWLPIIAAYKLTDYCRK